MSDADEVHHRFGSREITFPAGSPEIEGLDALPCAQRAANEAGRSRDENPHFRQTVRLT